MTISPVVFAMNRPLLRQRGLSLIELMMAIAIGMFLLLGLSSLLVANSQSSQELNKTGNQIENGRFAIQLLTDDIHLAGFLGAYAPSVVGTTWSTPDPCAVAVGNLGINNGAGPMVPASTVLTIPVGIYGYAGGSALPASCATAVTNQLAGTGVIVVRRVSTTTTTPAAATATPAGDFYLQASTCADGSIDTVPFVLASDSAAANFPLRQIDCLSTNLAPLRKYMVRIYYVSSCSDCGNDTIPTLKFVELKGGALAAASPLVEGIENMQLDYGIDMDGDGSVDCYTSNPASPPGKEVDPATFPATACPQTTPVYVWTNATTNWSNVMAVRVNLLARNLDQTTRWVDNKTYDMGLTGSTTATNDAFKRHAYSTVARLYNISGQREK